MRTNIVLDDVLLSEAAELTGIVRRRSSVTPGRALSR
jgi:hypothetical protein